MKFCLQIILSFSVSKTANKAFLLTKWQHLSNKTNKIKMLIHLWFERADSRHRQTFCFCLAQHHKLLATSDYTQWANTHRWRKTSPEHMQTECTSHIIDTQNYTQRVRSRSEDRRARPGGGSHSSGVPTATAGSLFSDRSMTLRQPQNAAQRHVSPSAARSSALRAVSRILVTTSGELILLPVGGRQPKLNLGWCPVTSYSDSDIPSSS